jgi:hypothetical protein
MFLHRLGAAAKCLANFGIGPVRAVSIRLEQHLRPSNSLRRPFQLRDNCSSDSRSESVTRTICFLRMAQHVLGEATIGIFAHYNAIRI